jgi:hypothetical protein
MPAASTPALHNLCHAASSYAYAHTKQSIMPLKCCTYASLHNAACEAMQYTHQMQFNYGSSPLATPFISDKRNLQYVTGSPSWLGERLVVPTWGLKLRSSELVARSWHLLSCLRPAADMQHNSTHSATSSPPAHHWSSWHHGRCAYARRGRMMLPDCWKLCWPRSSGMPITRWRQDLAEMQMT